MQAVMSVADIRSQSEERSLTAELQQSVMQAVMSVADIRSQSEERSLTA